MYLSNCAPKYSSPPLFLVQLGFNFRVHVDKWTEHFEELKTYKSQYGHCMVPTHYASNPKLGRWVHTQRHQRRLLQKNKKSTMTERRVQQLDELGFSWEVRPSQGRPRATWQQRWEELSEYQNENGDFVVSADENFDLHLWVHEQKLRLVSLHNKGSDGMQLMSPERVERLRSIGFDKDSEVGTMVEGGLSMVEDGLHGREDHSASPIPFEVEDDVIILEPASVEVAHASTETGEVTAVATVNEHSLFAANLNSVEV
jgi:hypothetical protein